MEEDFSGLPDPRIFLDENTGRLYMEMAWKGSVAQERLPLEFIDMTQEKQKWHIQSSRIVERLFKKLGLKVGKR